MADYVDANAATAMLAKAWADIKSDTRPPAQMQKLIEKVLAATDVTYGSHILRHRLPGKIRES